MLAVSIVPSVSKSPASVKSPIFGVSSLVVITSLSNVGASFIAFMVMNTTAVSHNGVAVVLSHTRYMNWSVPLKLTLGI